MGAIEIFACCIRPPKAVHRMLLQRLFQHLEIARRYHAIAVEENEIRPLCALNAIVASNATPFILFPKIVHAELIGVGSCNVVATLCGAVLHQKQLKIVVGLLCQTLQQITHFAAPIIHRHNHRKIRSTFISSHHSLSFISNLIANIAIIPHPSNTGTAPTHSLFFHFRFFSARLS